jgi:hypothetical protein
MHSKVHKARLLAVHSQMDRPEQTPEDPPTIHAYFALLQHIFHRNKQTIRSVKDSPLRTLIAPQIIERKAKIQLRGMRTNCYSMHQCERKATQKSEEDLMSFMPIGAAYQKLKQSDRNPEAERLGTSSCVKLNSSDTNKLKSSSFGNRKYSFSQNREKRQHSNRARTEYSPNSMPDSLRTSYRSHRAMEPPAPTPW